MFVMRTLVLSLGFSSYLYPFSPHHLEMEAFFTIRIAGAKIQLTGLCVHSKSSESSISVLNLPPY